jgi:hypothetical protein
VTEYGAQDGAVDTQEIPAHDDFSVIYYRRFMVEWVIENK